MLGSLIHLEFTLYVWYGIGICFHVFTKSQFSYYHLVNIHSFPLISETTPLRYQNVIVHELCLCALCSVPLVSLFFPESIYTI